MGIELPGTSFAASLTEDVSRMDIYNRLLKDRIVFLGTDVNDDIANFITAQMLYLEGQDPEKDIWLYINSPGGSVTSGMAIYDTMNFVSPDVGTICMGLGASMGQFLLGAGAKGKRFALPHACLLYTSPSPRDRTRSRMPSSA